MKLSCQEHLIPGISFLDKVHWLEQNHFQGIELWGFHLKDRMNEIVAALELSEIKISAICGGYEGDLFSLNDSSTLTAIRGIKELIKLASKLNAPGIILVPSFGRTELAGILSPFLETTDEMVETFAAGLKEIVLFAEEHGVQLYLEAINRYECPAFNRITHIAKICSLINSSTLTVLADTYHMNMEENNVEIALRDVGTKLGYIHLADSNRFIPGAGHLNFEPIVQALQDVGYEGFLSFECFIRDGQMDLIKARDHMINTINQSRVNICRLKSNSQ